MKNAYTYTCDTSVPGAGVIALSEPRINSKKSNSRGIYMYIILILCAVCALLTKAREMDANLRIGARSICVYI